MKISVKLKHLRGCYVTNIYKIDNTFNVCLFTPFFNVKLIYKYLRKTSPVGTVYVYVGDNEIPYIEKFYLNGYDGKFPKLEDLKSWTEISLNILRWRILPKIKGTLEDMIIDSVYYRICDTEKPVRKKPEKLWK